MQDTHLTRLQHRELYSEPQWKSIQRKNVCVDITESLCRTAEVGQHRASTKLLCNKERDLSLFSTFPCLPRVSCPCLTLIRAVPWDRPGLALTGLDQQVRSPAEQFLEALENVQTEALAPEL